MEKQNKSHTYRFLNSEDEEKILNGWGGSSFVREKYPAVWAAIKRTKEYEREVQQTNGTQKMVNGHVQVGCPSLVEESETGKKRLSALLSLRLEDGTLLTSTSGSGENVESKTWPYAMLSGTIQNMTDRIILASYAEEYYNLNQEDHDLKSDTIYNGMDFTHKNVETFCSYSAVDFNDVIHQEDKYVSNPDYADLEGNLMVQRFDVQAPVSIHGNNQIKVLYDRVPESSEVGLIDYTYKNVRSNTDVKTCIPIKAELAFANGIVPADEDGQGNPLDILSQGDEGSLPFQPQLFFGNPTITKIQYNRTYEAIKTCFKRNVDLLEIDFSTLDPTDYWNVNMSMNNYETAQYETGRTVELHADFYIRLLKQKLKMVVTTGISIVSVSPDKLPRGASYYHTQNGMTVYIPQISIRWGCFAADTRITMIDGSHKPAELIRSGDILFSLSGPAKVKTVYRGDEISILCICTEKGRKLRITPGHPVMLAEGKIVRGKNVRPGQYLKTADGEDRVKWVYEVPYAGKVYNFEFADGQEHIIAAEEIMTGDYLGQNSCHDILIKKEPHITPQTQSLVEQLSALENMKKSKILF